MMRRNFMGGLLALLGLANSRTEASPLQSFPPVPKWRPIYAQPLDQVAGRISYYANGKSDFVVFRYGTCVMLQSGISDEEASAFARGVLANIISHHPDMNPRAMDDGNVLVSYNYPAVNVVLRALAKDHWEEIEKRHLDGLTESEVLITPLGPNKFDEFGKLGLLGRAYMFMDGEQPEIDRIVRHS